MTEMETIAQRIEQVQETLLQSIVRAGRKQDEVRLMAVTKFVPIERIAEAADAGLTLVGENRAQEFTEKLNFYKQRNLEAHFIGQLQTNKIKYICGNADVIQSVDRPALLEAIDARAQRQGVVQSILLQVNIGDEPQKGGVAPDALDALLEQALLCKGICLRGLMCVPPAGEPESARPYFRRMRALFERASGLAPSIDTLSMGMSHDYPVAVEEGATLVRVGTAIFGARNTQGGTVL